MPRIRPRIHNLTDALSMAKALKGEEDWNIKVIVEDISNVDKAFQLPDISFIHIKFNRDPHLFG